jgi:tRNA (cytidine/uridine-2'-O-)-methyltransferase
MTDPNPARRPAMSALPPSAGRTRQQSDRMLHVILYQPEIPPNTGNVIRLCANTGATLHLVEPLGFQLTAAAVKRAGLDYHELADIHRHNSWGAFLERAPAKRIWAFSTRATRCHTDVAFADGDGLLFGPETRGLPDALLEVLGSESCLRLPMREGARSLNLSNSVAVAVYEAWRQLGFR